MRTAFTIKSIAGVAVASALVMSSAAQATLLYSVSGPGVSGVEEQGFLDYIKSGTAITETFEDFSAGAQQASFLTDIGTFTGSGNAVGSSCSDAGFTCGAGMGIVDQNIMAISGGGTDNFWGRYPMPVSDGNNQYMDTLDHEKVVLTLNSGYNALGFFLTDPNDSGGILDITVDGSDDVFSKSIDDILGGSQPNKGSYYFSFFSWAGDISSVTFRKNNSSDGVGFDNVTIGVPEPGTIGLLGLGLLGLGIARRRKTA